MSRVFAYGVDGAFSRTDCKKNHRRHHRRRVCWHSRALPGNGNGGGGGGSGDANIIYNIIIIMWRKRRPLVRRQCRRHSSCPATAWRPHALPLFIICLRRPCHYLCHRNVCAHRISRKPATAHTAACIIIIWYCHTAAGRYAATVNIVLPTKWDIVRI